MPYQTWLHGLCDQLTCTLAFLDGDQPGFFKLKSGRIDGESQNKGFWRIRFHNGVNHVPVWIKKDTGSGDFLGTPVFAVPNINPNQNTASPEKIGYPLPALTSILKHYAANLNEAGQTP